MAGCGGGGHDHSHDECNHHDNASDLGTSYSLYTKIDIENVQCLNESIEDSGKTVFKAWEDRLTLDKFVSSDADEELIFNIPFTGQIKLKGIVIIGGEGGHHPNKMRLFKNSPYMTFDDANRKPDQEFGLHPDSNGTLEYNTRAVIFSSVSHLTIHFPSNYGEEETKVYYIGLKGDFTKAHRHGVTICSYETTPQYMDHKSKAFNPAGREIL